MAESGCVGCDASHPCDDCAKRAHASGEIDGMEDSRRTLPVVQRQRTVTGGHRAVVIVDERAHVPASGDLDEADRELLESIRELPTARERETALREYMRAQRASEDQTRAAVAALAQGGLATLQQHLDNTQEERLARIRDAGQTARAQINADTQIALAEIAARAGISNPNQGGAGGGTSNPNTGMQTTNPTTSETPATGLSTGAKVAIGVGAGAAVLTVGYLLWQAMENRRREEEERRRRDEEFRLRMMQAGAR